MADSTRSAETPIAFKTWLPFCPLRVHAEPGETYTPFSLRARTITSAGIPENDTFTVFATPSSGEFKKVCGISDTPATNTVRNARIDFSYSSILFCAFSVAAPIPTMAGTFGVPERKPNSWPPPVKNGCGYTPSSRRINTPTPFGACILCPLAAYASTFSR